jgi:predicted TIM-barrel fold metal-dependent hydrolase
MPREFPEHPVEVFKRNVWVNPFWEDSLENLISLIGTDRVCFGSDYPHPEGLGEPLEFVDQVTYLDRADLQRVMSGNMYELVDIPKPVAPAA